MDFCAKKKKKKKKLILAVWQRSYKGKLRGFFLCIHLRSFVVSLKKEWQYAKKKMLSIILYPYILASHFDEENALRG